MPKNIANPIETVDRMATNHTIIPIVLSADNNYASQMYITMFSTLKNANENTFCDFYLLVHPNFEQRYKDEITKLGGKYNCKISFIDMGTAFADVPSIGWPAAAYYRLATANLLPNHAKCLYLDVDILVRHNLKDLYNTDIDSCYVAGVKDMGIIDNEWQLRYTKFDLQIPDPHQYINSGVLLMNLDLIRKTNFVESWFFTIKHGIDGKKSLVYPDQDALNKLCYDKIKFLDPKYNLFSYQLARTKKSQELQKKLENLFGKEQFEKACVNPSIVHFAWLKSWRNPSLPYADEWWECARQTPFYEEILHKRID
ncbi:MAG: glycosyltransferase family 8 protein [Puniceicoccales bacterium]|jgi:lipopolysaccharide biosynthesis glycosyltransferase|nr:glycosyltransferase family 8 protein [Puniceicoccales bacterium]